MEAEAGVGSPLLPDRAMSERVVELQIPDIVWEYWSHPMQTRLNLRFLPFDIVLSGPACLLHERSDYFCHMHIPFAEQIPLLRYFRESMMVLVATPNDRVPVWAGAALAGERSARPYQLSLEGMFESWTEALRTGFISWNANGEGTLEQPHAESERESEMQQGHEWPHPALRLPYSIFPDVAGNPAFGWLDDLTLAAGAVLNYDDDLVPIVEVEAQGRARQERWVELTGEPVPPELRLDRFGFPLPEPED